MKKQEEGNKHFLLYLVAGLMFSFFLLSNPCDLFNSNISCVGAISGLFLTGFSMNVRSEITISYLDLAITLFILVSIMTILIILWRRYRHQWQTTRANQKELENMMNHIPMPIFIVD